MSGIGKRVAIFQQLVSPIWAMLEYGWYPLLLFIATPWFLHELGTEQYGYWMLLTATVGFGGVLNTGTGAATIKSVSAGIGRTSNTAIESTIRTSLAIALIGGSVLALLVFSIFWLAGAELLGRMGNLPLLRLTGVAAALLIWLEQQDNVFSSAMKGAEYFGHAARVEMASKTGQILAAALILLVWRRLWALYAALLVVAVLRLMAKIIISKRLLGFTNLWPTLSGASEILHFAKWGWLQGVGGVLFGVVDRMLVGSLLGASSLTYYSIATQLSTQVHAISAAGLSVIFPKVSRKLEGGSHFSLWRVTKLTMAGNLLLSTTLALGLLFFGRKLLVFWLGASQALPVADVLPYLVIAYWILALNIAPHYILLSLGRFRFISLSNITAGLILAIVIAVIATTYGIVGVATARILYGLIILVNFVPLIKYLHREQHA